MFEVESKYNMLDQHLVIHFTGTSSQEISLPPLDTPTPSSYPFPSPYFFSFLLHLSSLSLPLLLANISGNLSCPSGLPFHHTQACPSLLYLYRASLFPWVGFGAPCSHVPLAAWGRACFNGVKELRILPVSNSDEEH